MRIVTGLLHVGKTTLLEQSGKMFARWDDWFPVYLQSQSGIERISHIVPSEYLEHPGLVRKLLAVSPDMMQSVCNVVADTFREFASFTDFVEVPIYALSSIKRDGDIVIAVDSPGQGTLIERCMTIHKCNRDRATKMVANQSHELSFDCRVNDVQDLLALCD